MIVKRLKEYIDYKGTNISAFERSIGMSNASFGKSLKSGGNIGSDKLETILKVYPDINPQWLLTGEGKMLKPAESRSGKVSDYRSPYTVPGEHGNKAALQTEKSGLIPLYDIKAGMEVIASAGAAGNEPLDYIRLPDVHKCDGALCIRGDSTHPLFRSGDIVLSGW